MTTRVHVTLTTLGPFAIGTGGEEDRSAQRDQRGRPVLPGTSLAGGLRAASMRRYGTEVTERLFGQEQMGETGQRGGSSLRASRVTVYDAEYTHDRPPATEVRQHVGVDRDRLAAKPRLLFETEVWPAGTSFAVTLDCPDGDTSHVLGLFEELGLPPAGIGAGNCPVQVSGIRASRLTGGLSQLLETAERRWSGDGVEDPAVAVEQLPPPAPRTADPGGWVWARLRLTVRLEEPLANRIPVDPTDPERSNRDNLAFGASRLRDDGVQEWTVGLAGSSLDGVLRTRAERVLSRLRTRAGGAPAPDPWTVAEDNPVTRLFGWSPQAQRGWEDVGRAGRLYVPDLLADHWLEGDDVAVLDVHPAVQARARVGIDRLTGSTYKGALFTDVAVRAGTLLHGCMIVRPAQDGRLDARDLALLSVVLRDLFDGQVGVGGSGHSGYGTLTLHGAELELGSSTEVRMMPAEVAEGALVWPDEFARLIRAGWAALREEAAA